MDYDEYFSEPSESDIAFDELKEHLKNEVKNEIKSELERLEKENQELQDVKKNWKKLENEYKEKEKDLDYKINQVEREALRKPIKELFDNVSSEYYIVIRNYEKLPKCDKCNDERKLEYVDIFGRKHKFDCTCNEYYYTNYFVEKKYMLNVTEFSKRDSELTMWVRLEYNKSDNGYNDGYYSSQLLDPNKIIKNWKQFEDKDKKDIEYSEFLFFKKEDAQKYADELNKELEEGEKCVKN